MESPGQTISHYKLLDRLGAGGMGVVYRAEDLKLDRVVALKFLPPHLSANERAKTRFMTEAKAASALDHPNIGTIYGIDETPDQGLFIVMAYYAGESLAARLDKGSLPPAEAVEIAIQAGEGLAEAHARGIVHRDVKPSNLIVTASGLVKVLDFGLAKVENLHLTDAGVSLGTPAFMSPEQTRGERVDQRCDVWGLGVLLFNMLAGYLPFNGSPISNLLRSIREDPPARLPVLPDLRVIVLKALSKKPRDRYQTMRSLLDELREVQPKLAHLPRVQAGAAARSIDQDEQDDIETAIESEVVTRTVPAVLLSASGELRQLTVLSCDLVDYEALGERLEPQQLRDVLLAYQRTYVGAIVPFDGRVEQHRDAEVRIHFGYPEAHEDDALRAVTAGLEIAARIQALSTELEQTIPVLRQFPLQCRVGIHTGQVVAGEVGSAAQPRVVGIVGSQADKVLGVAEANQVVISDHVHRLVRGFFNVRPLEPQKVSGFSAPVTLYHVLGRTSAESRIEAVGGSELTPLVSRTREIDFLAGCWEEVSDGAGQLVLISADAGVGKSRLVYALKERLAAETQAILECRCSPYHQNSPLSPIVDPLCRVLGLNAVPSAGKFAVLRSNLAKRGIDAPNDVWALASLLAVPAPKDFPAPEVAAPRQREQTLASVIRLLLALTSDRPLLFIVEDLHWIDPTTVELLNLLVDQGPTARILAVLTFRPEFHSPWGQRAHIHLLSLGRLTRRESEEMIARLTNDKRLPPEVLAHIVASSDGVPLFIEELTKGVLESDILRETADDAYELKAPLASLSIPTTLADSLRARLDRLGGAREVGQFASVFGRTFSFKWLEAVWPLGERALRADLSRLVDAEILYQRGVPPEATYTFKHALIRDAAYLSLLPQARQQYHGHIVRAFEERFPQIAANQPELLAHHCTDAGLLDQAGAYWRRAGQQAVQRSAHVEAAAHFLKGLELTTSLPETADRRQRRLDFAIALGGSRIALMGYAAPAVGDAYRQAFELCDQVGETTQLFDALQGLWAFHVVRAELRTGLDLSVRLTDLAARLKDAARGQEASLRRAISLYTIGDLSPAREHMEKVLAHTDPAESRESALLFGQHRDVAAMSHLSWVLWVQGFTGRGLTASEEAVARAKGLSHPFTLAFALLYSAMLHTLSRDPATVQEQATELATLCEEQAFAYRLAQSHVLSGWARAIGGRDVAAIEQMAAAIRKIRATGAEVLRPYYLMLLVDACLQLEQRPLGLQSVDEALEAVEQTGERLFEAELHRLRGELLAGANGSLPTEAVGCLQKAIATARAQEAASFELRAALSLAQLDRSDSHARQQLEAIVERIPAGFETPDLGAATRLLSGPPASH